MPAVGAGGCTATRHWGASGGICSCSLGADAGLFPSSVCACSTTCNNSISASTSTPAAISPCTAGGSAGVAGMAAVGACAVGQALQELGSVPAVCRLELGWAPVLPSGVQEVGSWLARCLLCCHLRCRRLALCLLCLLCCHLPCRCLALCLLCLLCCHLRCRRLAVMPSGVQAVQEVG